MKNKIAWVCQILAAAILAQTLFFKFTAAPESVYIFTKMGVEPYGRIGSGIVELVAAILLVIPSLAAFGALISVGVMAGAIFSHLTVLGVVVQDDGGELFALACIVFISSAIVLFIRRETILRLLKRG